MGIQALSSALAGIVACFPVMTATAMQVHPPCAPSVALSTDTKQFSPHVTLVRDRYLDPTCSVPAPTDTVRQALEALSLMEASAWNGPPGVATTAPEVTIAGEVQRPLSVEFREGMTLGDLITEAGRLKQTADLTVEVYRVMRSVDGERQPIPEIHSIRVDSAYLVNHDAKRLYAKHIAGFTYLVDRAAAFKLMPYDRVVVKTPPRARLFSR